MRRFSPPLWSIALTVAASLWILEEISRQVAFLISACCVVPICLVLLLNYFYWLVGAPDTKPEVIESRHGGAWRWIVLPSALIVVTSALLHPWPMTLRFSLSRSAFEKKVEEMDANPNEQGPQRVGLYWVSRIFVRDGCVGFRTGTSLIDPCGFAYDPSRPPSGRHNWHIIDDWYAAVWG